MPQDFLHLFVRLRAAPAATRPLRSAFLLLLTLGLAACGDAPPAMEVAGVAFTAENVLGLSPGRQALLRSVTAFGVAVAREELDTVAVPLVRRAEADALWQALQVEEILAEEGVEEAVLEARYRTTPEHELTVRHLIVLSERFESDSARTAAREKAARALERIRAGEAFPEVAAEVSEEPGAEGRQGLLQPGRRGAWVDEFWDAASALEVGEISPVVETQYGFHVIRLEGREEVPFPEVRDRVAARVAGMLGEVEPSADQTPLPGGFQPAPGLDTLTREGAVAATFDGGEVTLADVLDRAATLDAATWAAVLDGQAGAREGVAEDAARAEAVRIQAGARGMEVPSGTRSTALDAWHARAGEWARILGFTPGMGMEAVKATALDALARSGQLVTLTRDDVHAGRGLLERHYGPPGA